MSCEVKDCIQDIWIDSLCILGTLQKTNEEFYWQIFLAIREVLAQGLINFKEYSNFRCSEWLRLRECIEDFFASLENIQNRVLIDDEVRYLAKNSQEK
jgi:hypothetical protein